MERGGGGSICMQIAKRTSPPLQGRQRALWDCPGLFVTPEEERAVGSVVDMREKDALQMAPPSSTAKHR